MLTVCLFQSIFYPFFKAQVTSEPYLFPFMCLEDQNSLLSKLYQQVRTAMLDIVESNGSEASIGQLIKVANNW